MRWHLDSHFTKQETETQAAKHVPKGTRRSRRAHAPRFHQAARSSAHLWILPQVPSGLQWIRGRKPLRVGNHWRLFLNSNLRLYSETNELNQKPLSLGNPGLIGTALSIQISPRRSRCSHCSRYLPWNCSLPSQLPATGPTLCTYLADTE